MSAWSSALSADTDSLHDSYIQLLNTAWQAHLAPRQDDAPTVISTFAGIGGSSLGYSMAGYRELLAVEWDSAAVRTFALNFPGVPVYEGDIAQLSVEQCLEMAGIEPGQLDILDGSPPCQGFSMTGKRRFDDNRNYLFREYVRLLRGLRPRVIVVENVSGLIRGKMKLIFAEMMRELTASGYRVRAALLNARYFNVPQNRPRVIFIGVRNDLAIEPSFPEPARFTISAETALKNAPIKEKAPPLSPYDLRVWHHQYPGQFGYYRQGHHVAFNYTKMNPVKPSPAILRGTNAISHWQEPRGLHLGELMRLASFPDDFQFAGRYADALAGIGNSVPPLFMYAIAKHIRQTILDTIVG